MDLGAHYAGCKLEELRSKSDNERFMLSLPVPWRKSVFLEDPHEQTQAIQKFQSILSGYKKAEEQLDKAIRERALDSEIRYVHDLDDFDYDEYVGQFEKVDSPALPKSQLYRYLVNLLKECRAEKERLIAKSEEFASMNGKPPTISLKKWLALAPDVRHAMSRGESAQTIELMVDKLYELKTDNMSILRRSAERMVNQPAPNCVQVRKDEFQRMLDENEKLKLKNYEIQQDRAAKEEVINYYKARVVENERKIKELAKINADLRNQLQSNSTVALQQELAREKRSVDRLRRHQDTLEEDKERLLTRLSQVAGSKLTTNNPAITDLSDENRPMKLAEKFSQMYDDEWTDSLEEILSNGLDEVASVAFLLRVVMSAFHLCTRSRSMFINLHDCRTLLWCEGSVEIKVAQRLELTEEEKVALEGATRRLKYSRKDTFIDVLKKKFLVIMKGMLLSITRKRKCDQRSPEEAQAEQVTNQDVDGEKEIIDEDKRDQKENHQQSQTCLSQDEKLFNRNPTPSKVRKKEQKGRLVESARGDFSMPSYTSYLSEGFLLKKEEIEELFSVPMEYDISEETMAGFAKTLQFAEHCVELCWLMQAGKPPLYLDADIPENRQFQTEILKQYTKKGNSIDYIVWPVLYLHKNGPLLSKGVAQPR